VLNSALAIGPMPAETLADLPLVAIIEVTGLAKLGM
jgi:hypothetical protein